MQVELTRWIGDYERSTTFTRYYFAKRIGGNPASMGWESQAVLLIPKVKLATVLDHANDKALVNAILAQLA